jgi:hypothetical protein
VLHAETLDAPPYFTRAQIDSLEAEAQATRTRAIEFLRAFVQPHVSVPVEVEIDARVPTDAILRASVGTDLVVMGTHGRRGPSRWWLGSVAERVLRETTVPLLVVHAGRAVDQVGLSRGHAAAAGDGRAGDADARAGHGAGEGLRRIGVRAHLGRSASRACGVGRDLGGGAGADAALGPVARAGRRAARERLPHAGAVRA